MLGVDDSILLMSDGITDLGDDWLKGELNNMPNGAQESADYILEKALEKMKDKKIDDMSIIIARLERNK